MYAGSEIGWIGHTDKCNWGGSNGEFKKIFNLCCEIILNLRKSCTKFPYALYLAPPGVISWQHWYSHQTGNGQGVTQLTCRPCPTAIRIQSRFPLGAESLQLHPETVPWSLYLQWPWQCVATLIGSTVQCLSVYTVWYLLRNSLRLCLLGRNPPEVLCPSQCPQQGAHGTHIVLLVTSALVIWWRWGLPGCSTGSYFSPWKVSLDIRGRYLGTADIL